MTPAVATAESFVHSLLLASAMLLCVCCGLHSRHDYDHQNDVPSYGVGGWMEQVHIHLSGVMI